MQRAFGDGLCDIFMIPYNEKLWGVTLDQMNATWVRGRFPHINVEELKKLIEERRVLSWGDNAYFRYPKYGGNGGTWTKLAEWLPQEQINLNCKVTSIDPIKKVIHFENG